MKCTWCVEFFSVGVTTSSQTANLRGQGTFISGSSHLRIDAVQDHEKSRGHEKAAKHHYAKTHNPAKSAAGIALKQLNAVQKDQLELKLKNAFAVAKRGRPFSDFMFLCLLDETKGLKPGTAYRNMRGCESLVAAIAGSIRNETKHLISQAKFLSITMDGTTDVAGEEQQSLYLQLSVAGVVHQRYLCVATPENLSAKALYEMLIQQLELEGVPISKLVGFGSDGAATMMGIRSGVATLLKQQVPHLIPVHCLAHRLELCFKDAIKREKLFDKADTLLVGLYYLYKKSYKQKKSLMDTFALLKMKPILPPRVGGTRWLGHLSHALSVFFQGYEAFVAQLSNNSHESAKIKGLAHLAVSKDAIMFLLILKEIVQPIQKLSKFLQNRDVTLGAAKGLVEATQAALRSCVTRNIPEVDAIIETGIFHGTQLLQSRSPPNLSFKQRIIESIVSAMDDRFDEVLDGVLATTEVTNFKIWPEKTEMEEFGAQHVMALCDHFKELFLASEIDGDSLSMEWTTLKFLIYRRYRDDVQTLTWPKIFRDFSGQAVDNILSVIDLLQSLPPTSVANEKTFSQLKYIKNNRRGKLSSSNLNNALLIRIEGPSVEEFDPQASLQFFLESCMTSKHKRRVDSHPYASTSNDEGKPQDEEEILPDDDDADGDGDQDKAEASVVLDAHSGTDTDSDCEAEASNAKSIALYSSQSQQE